MAQQPLAYVFEVDEHFTVEQRAVQKITQNIQGTEQIITNDISGILDFTVKSVNNDQIELSMMFTDLVMKMSSNLMGTLMDINANDTSDESMETKIFNSILNKPFTLIMQKNGKITSVSGGKELVDLIVNKLDLPDENTKALISETLLNSYGSNALAESFTQMTYYLPDTAVKSTENAQWKNQYTGKLSATTTWTLLDAQSDSWKIEGKAPVVINTNENGVTMNLEGNQSTIINGNKGSWLFQDITVEQEATGSSVMPQLGDQKIPTNITSTITYNRIK
ncbi:hypothetical protein GCM10009117_10590 [Gangjinia marincola]|uniref:Uncharacterized protein n=1 Tax=Gangjinia marincola TaxID=578463 RepID=A0ABP3XUM3_9FLAO